VNEYLKTGLDCLAAMTRETVPPEYRLRAAELLARYALDIEYCERHMHSEDAVEIAPPVSHEASEPHTSDGWRVGGWSPFTPFKGDA